jgi:hypothetical protein
MFHGIAVFLLILLVCVYLDSLRPGVSHDKENAEDRELSRQWRRLDRQERLSALYAACQEPWPWWFLGSCLAFSGLCLVAGATSWPANDAPVLLIGGTLFLLAFAFKAFAQERARREPPPVPPAQQ